MSNIAVTHAASGLVEVQVLRRTRVTPHMTRVTFGGSDLERFEFQGFDQWLRLAIPVHDGDRFDNLPARFGVDGYLRYLALPKGTRPAIRNSTVRDFRRDPLELDVDLIAHGTGGVAAPWAASAQPGERAAFIDQGRGWRDVPADWLLIVADESGLPAAAGVLRDLPRDARGHAIVELFDLADGQHVDAPAGVQVHWLERPAGTNPGSAALPVLAELTFSQGRPYAFAVGESALAAGVRRHLVGTRGLAKEEVTFCGYWRLGRAAPS